MQNQRSKWDLFFHWYKPILYFKIKFCVEIAIPWLCFTMGKNIWLKQNSWKQLKMSFFPFKNRNNLGVEAWNLTSDGAN